MKTQPSGVASQTVKGVQSLHARFLGRPSNQGLKVKPARFRRLVLERSLRHMPDLPDPDVE